MPKRRPASISSRTVRRATSSPICAPARRRAACAPRTLPLDVMRAARLAACVGHQPGDLAPAHATPCSPRSTRRAAAGALVTYDPEPAAQAVAAARGRARSSRASWRVADWCLPSSGRCATCCSRARAGRDRRRVPSRRRAGRRAEAAARRLRRFRRPRRERARGALGRAASMRPAPAIVSTARSPRARWPATIPSPPRATRTSPRRSRPPASAPSRRCRATRTCARSRARALA